MLLNFPLGNLKTTTLLTILRNPYNTDYKGLSRLKQVAKGNRGFERDHILFSGITS